MDFPTEEIPDFVIWKELGEGSFAWWRRKTPTQGGSDSVDIFEFSIFFFKNISDSESFLDEKEKWHVGNPRQWGTWQEYFFSKSHCSQCLDLKKRILRRERYSGTLFGIRTCMCTRVSLKRNSWASSVQSLFCVYNFTPKTCYRNFSFFQVDLFFSFYEFLSSRTLGSV